MKVRSICASTLVAVIGVAVLGTATPAFAAPESLDSTGKVTVEEGTAGGGDQGTVDPENPDEKLPTPDPTSPGENTNTDKGSLVIEKTTDLDFGTIKTSANAVTAYAKPMTFSGGTATRGAYVQWADVRAGGTYGYTITAKMSQQFTDTGKANTLTGSTITFSNPLTVAEAGNTNVAPSNTAATFTLDESGDAATVVTASKTNKEGKGRYVTEFGQSKDYTGVGGQKGTDGNSVQLTVPATTAANMAATNYTATITWAINAAK